MSAPAKQVSYPSAPHMAPPPYSAPSVPPPAYDEPPAKYAVIDGVRQLNPEYKKYMAQQGKPATTALRPDVALPVVSNMDQHQQLRDASLKANSGDVPLAKSTDATIDMLQDPDYCRKIGLGADQAVDALGNLFAKYEVPMGLMNKLMGLTEFNYLEFTVDDSGSMGTRVSASQTRWGEAHERLKTLVEILAYIPTPRVVIKFLNRADRIVLERKGEDPQTFIGRAYQQIDQAFKRPPDGMTPVERSLQDSFREGAGKKVARYLFCDGVPDGGDAAKGRIAALLKTRQNPADNPMTLLSCSENDKDVEWMKVVEEAASFCAECDDFLAEAEEVRGDQGDVFPYTVGFYLLCQLVGAMNPNDLDALDESVPFTKWTLDNLLGVTNSEQDYRRYFDGFLRAQRERKVDGPLDTINLLKKQQNWEASFGAFLRERDPQNIPAVREFKEKLQKCDAQDVAPQFGYLKV
ncbi:MAG: hypothetical protein JSS32_05080 [Verrucomicrobia bacterium]|nr:hypothetical protein [Verrucomicrobiota bacterium]